LAVCATLPAVAINIKMLTEITLRLTILTCNARNYNPADPAQ